MAKSYFTDRERSSRWMSNVRLWLCIHWIACIKDTWISKPLLTETFHVNEWLCLDCKINLPQTWSLDKPGMPFQNMCEIESLCTFDYHHILLE